MLMCWTGAEQMQTSAVPLVFFTFKFQIPASKSMLSNFPLDISRGFHLIVFTVQTLLCDCISRENGARQRASCRLKGADSLWTPGHFSPSLVVLVNNQALCVNCLQILPFLPPFLAPKTLIPTPSSQGTRFLSWPLGGRLGSLGSCSGRQPFCSRCTQLV